MDAVESGNDGDAVLLDRAVRLFTFLRRVQQLRNRAVRTVGGYSSVTWLHELPDHPAVRLAPAPESPEGPVLTVDRLAPEPPPDPGPELWRWLDGTHEDSRTCPGLVEEITTSARTGQEPETIPRTEHPEVDAEYREWRAEWERWAARDEVHRPTRELYTRLFAVQVAATGNTEELELVLGVGCLHWAPPAHAPVRRHLLTMPAVIDLDEDTGALTVRRGPLPDGPALEVDMLDPGALVHPQRVDQVRAELTSLDPHPLDGTETHPLLRRLVHVLDANGTFSEEEPGAPTQHAVVSASPALLLRKRSQQGLVQIFQTITDQLTEAGVVPKGLLPLLDPGHRLAATADPSPGAVVDVDGDPFLPLPVNDVQLRVLHQVDTKAQTLVQGPPGTGKTHTAAALLSHLLAQGKRVLVTAHTDRALREVRDKLPPEIRPLSVAVVGASRDDMADLKVAVARIGAAAAEHDPVASQAVIDTCLATIDDLRRQRAAVHQQLLRVREDEVTEQEHAGYRGTLAALAHRHQAEAAEFGWLTELVEVAADAPVPLTDGEVTDWLALLGDTGLHADEPEARRRLPELTHVPEPPEFARLLTAETGAATAAEAHRALREHPAFPAVRRLAPTDRDQLARRLHRLADEADELAHRRESWMDEALADVRSGRAAIWESRARQVDELVGQADRIVSQLGPLTEVVVRAGELGTLTALARSVREVAAAGRLRTGADGLPKTGMLTPKVVKEAQPLFTGVVVNGQPPTTAQAIDEFLLWAEAERALAVLDRAWPESVRVPAEDTQRERLQWHVAEAGALHRVLRLSAALVEEGARVTGLGLPVPDWSDLAAVRGYADLVDAAATADAHTDALAPIAGTEAVLVDAAHDPDIAAPVHDLLAAVRQRAPEAYATAYARLVRLAQVREQVARRDELAARLDGVPALRAAVAAEPSDPVWPGRLARFEAAWAWAATGAWVLAQDATDVNALQREARRLEELIRQQVVRLAAERAWGHAVSPSRIDGQARADLEQYAFLVRKLGKGTGVHAARKRADIRSAMDRCRPSVPVWIMPIYRIAEQLRVRPDMFDVVVVDEASQAGMEATFLQYLAPRIVVIGDDRQVSPSAVGVDRQELRDLANQYLADDPYKASWHEPERSLFDEAKMRYGGLLTLVEHRRCVPEIIGFSNRIAYEPDGVRLIPVRQHGVDRLDPIRTVHLPEGYTRGTTNKVNPVEADAIVEQIEKCAADPRYDGLTFGVISLLGPAQARAIETRLLARIPPEEWVARDLRCGDSTDFQGSERDVVFLSMVAAPMPGERLAALTHERYVQRYNVAASRAKDQMWLFHTVALADVRNPDCMRHQLLDYCQGVRNRQETGGGVGVVPEHERVSPFDSLFEQRVHNRLVDRGFTVVPQYEVAPYLLDLVVLGARARLAVECDGDAWHGPEAYERDLARQRELERCGWQFFRVRESSFVIDPAGTLSGLWQRLRELDIHPHGQRPGPVAAEPGADEPGAAPVADEPITPALAPPPVVAEPVLEERVSPVVSGALASYPEFTGQVRPALEVSTAELVAHLAEIVAVEGPVVGQRLHNAYVRASGQRKVGHVIARALNSAISQAVRRGELVEDNPLDEAGVKPRTYRLPDQPAVRPRALGPRLFEQVPPAELAALLARAAQRHGWQDEEVLFREALAALGLKRLTDGVETRLRAVLALARLDGPLGGTSSAWNS
ncbi:very-short-patch-repair endonuclease [Crossiella equi]|uniref:Very-short-patch-repair endonuclease n=1 Tax=Crossiella equi TaxID=130796 RepID=A0ABS5A540_9PSEU|nr:AAA domain-containing protein [Crossiella equi]MBP2471708.1 very-short-patch-repair endonuclease [Crossiella equi]